MARARSAGMTLLELLVCLAIVGLLAGVGLAFARPAGDWRAGTGLKALLLWARAEAIWRGTAVAVTELPMGTGFVASLQEDGDAGCGAGVVLSRLLLLEHPGVSIGAGFGERAGLVWLPSGSGRGCDGGGVISASLRLDSQRGSTRVVVSSLGRVRLERVEPVGGG